MFNLAIARVPSVNFAEGLTTSGLPAPDYLLAVTQHEAYCRTLQQLGLTVIRLPADDRYPDSTFVEDTAVVTSGCAILTRPGAEPRQGEVEGMRTALTKFYSELHWINAPGTLDGGDVCQVEDHFFIGVSARTNEHGAAQLATILQRFGYTSTLVDIRLDAALLHLKSGLAYLGDGRVVLHDALAGCDEFREFEVIRLEANEAYAANCLVFGKTVLLASGYPHFESQLSKLGYQTIPLDMSEFQKMDGGLSCLSLRFLQM